MKKIILLSSAVLFVTNLLFGVILSFYEGCNVALSSTVIAATGALLYLTDTIHLKDGFKVSLMILFSIAGVVEFVFSLFAPDRFTNNWWLILVIGLIAFEAILLIISNILSASR